MTLKQKTGTSGSRKEAVRDITAKATVPLAFHLPCGIGDTDRPRLVKSKGVCWHEIHLLPPKLQGM